MDKINTNVQIRKIIYQRTTTCTRMGTSSTKTDATTKVCSPVNPIIWITLQIMVDLPRTISSFCSSCSSKLYIWWVWLLPASRDIHFQCFHSNWKFSNSIERMIDGVDQENTTFLLKQNVINCPKCNLTRKLTNATFQLLTFTF